MNIFFIVVIGLSSFLYGDFNRVNGVVIDSTTRLQWQDNYSDNANDIRHGDWMEAIEYCENLGLASQNDWRLPSINELSSLIDYSKRHPAINSIFEHIATSPFYWSSTTYVRYDTSAWTVYFGTGSETRYSKGFTRYVRCVRSG